MKYIPISRGLYLPSDRHKKIIFFLTDKNSKCIYINDYKPNRFKYLNKILYVYTILTNCKVHGKVVK